MLKINLWDLACKHYNFKEKECEKHKKECFMCEEYKIEVDKFKKEVYYQEN